MDKRREVVAALIYKEDRFMICRRPEGKARAGMWEFVGGKAEQGETLEAALVRECKEEIGVTVEVGEPYMTVEYDYPDIPVHLTLFRATVKEGEPTSMEGNAIQWITPEEIPFYLFCPADKSIIERLQKEAKK
ncbi:MAG: (deoxy)nucleoside triphosphate pyrophosphohydrolase [Clostridia bacterium]|nr:(deoxy)nucleoside triphosphate pyrophosphohydrolase [Clostridia bacterium]